MKRRFHPRWRSALIMAAVIASAIVIADAILNTTAGRCQVRIDSGDVRTKGLLFSYPKSKFRGRDQFIAASKELGIPAEWHDEHGAPSCPCCGPYFLYSGLEFWLEKEPAFGKLLLAAAAESFAHPEQRDQFPPVIAFTSRTHWIEATKSYEVDTSRFTSADFDFYLSEFNYSPEPNGYLATLRATLPAP